MISITDKAMKELERKGSDKIYISLKYIQGPCGDNLCKMIPKIEVSLVPKNINYVVFQVYDIKVHFHKLLAESILRHQDYVVIDYSSLRKSFNVKGITYSF